MEPTTSDKWTTLSRLVREGCAYFYRNRDRNTLQQYITHMVHWSLTDLVAAILTDRHSLDTSQELMVHYTSVPALFSMLDENALRLFDSDNLNDPNEGNFFVHNLDIPDRFGWACPTSLPHAYIASFIIPSSSEPRNDYLVYWRTYGKDGIGCSIALLPPPSHVWKVLYGEEQVRSTRELVVQLLDILDPLARIDDTLGQYLADTVWRALGCLTYLYKDEAYSYEHECRVVVSHSDLQPHEVLFEYSKPETRPLVRHYYLLRALPLHDLLSSSYTSITFGPAVTGVAALKRSVGLALRKLNLYGVQITESGISYRRS